MLRSFKLCVLFVNNRSTISLSYDGSVDLISFVRDAWCGDISFEGTLLPVMALTVGLPMTQFLLELSHYTTRRWCHRRKTHGCFLLLLLVLDTKLKWTAIRTILATFLGITQRCLMGASFCYIINRSYSVDVEQFLVHYIAAEEKQLTHWSEQEF